MWIYVGYRYYKLGTNNRFNLAQQSSSNLHHIQQQSFTIQAISFLMPSLKTNYIRTDITSQCFRYQFELLSTQPIDPKYYHQIEGYFLSLNPMIVFSYPYVYSIEQMNELKSFNFMLSNAQKVHVAILVQNTITLNSKDVAAEIHRQLMKGTNFLYSENLKICLNPFEERKINYNTSQMPGFSITTEITQNSIGFYLIPIQAKITQFFTLSSLHEHSIILDYNSGTFYQKSSIVRYDKQNQLMHFRTGEQLKKDSLKSLEILPLTGFQLAQKVSNYFKRIRQMETLKLFIEKWEIKFDSRFMELPYNFFPVSHILSGKKQEWSLGELVGSISAYNFQYNFKKLFQNITFDDSIRANILFLLPQIYTQPQVQQGQMQLEDQMTEFYTQLVLEEEQFLLPIIADFQNMKARMNLGDCRIVVLRYDLFVGWVNGTQKTLKQIAEIVQRENQNPGDKIFVLSNIENLLRQQRQLQLGAKWVAKQQDIQPVYKQVLNQFVQQGTYYHLINAKENQFRKAPEVVALKSFATIFSKLRLNPWKIKEVPFGTKPLMAFSLHVKQETNQSITITIVGSLNAFLSKYTCLVATCSQQQYHATVLRVITECMEKFKSIHTVYPKRGMIFRTGDFIQSYEDEFNEIQNKLVENYACKPTYILLSSNSPLRVYNQIDFNYISKDTVKSTQLLCQLKYNNQRYIQLESEWPLYKVNMLGLDPQEYNFEEKVIELMTKLCFTYQIMAEMKFGKGLGFLSYGEKLYNWTKDFKDIKGMEGHLREGLLMFL